MEVKYDKTAILDYIANFRKLQDLMRRDMDESLNKYSICKQEYSRIVTEYEEESHRAYNRVMSAESEIQMADQMVNQAMNSMADYDDNEDNLYDYDVINRVQEMRRQAEEDLIIAQADYSRAQINISKLNAVMEKYGSTLEAESKAVNNSFTECLLVGSKAEEALEQYMGIMDKAYSTLHGDLLIQNTSDSARNFSTSDGSNDETLGVVSYIIAGHKREFPNSKLGLNQAHRAAIKAKDRVAAREIRQAFNSFNDVNEGIESVTVNLEKSSQNVTWSDTEYSDVSNKMQIADRNSSILEWSGEKGNSLRIPKDKSGELAQQLKDLGVEGIPYINGDIDFSQVAKYEVGFDDAEKLYVDLGRTIKFSDLMTKDAMKSRTEFNGIIRKKWQEMAKQQIVDRISTDRHFAYDFAVKTGVNTDKIKKVSQLKAELKLNGLTLHETTDCKRIQLVPTQIHQAFKHAGGIAEMLERLINGDIHSKVDV